MHEITVTNQHGDTKVKGGASRLEKAAHIMDWYRATLRNNGYQVVESEYDANGLLMRFELKRDDERLTFEIVDRVTEDNLVLLTENQRAMMNRFMAGYTDDLELVGDGR